MMDIPGDNTAGFGGGQPQGAFRNALSTGLKGFGKGMMAGSGSSLSHAFNAAQGETEEGMDADADGQAIADKIKALRAKRKLLSGIPGTEEMI